MLFCNRRSVPNVGLFVDGDILIRVSVTKYLGLWLDDKLNWKHHQLKRCLLLSFKIVDKKCIKQLYCAYL